MHSANRNSPPDTRPEYMIALGLSPPYTHDDVMQAYYAKAKQVHPDHGGAVEDFRRLQEAFEKAKQYTEFKIDRRQWIAGKMDEYLATRRVIELLEALGAEVRTNAFDWLEKSFGDFAQLTEAINAVTLHDSPQAEQLLATMLQEQAALGSLTHLDLAGCQFSDSAAHQLDSFKQLTHLDLSGTQVTNDGLWFVDELPALESLNLDGTSVGWWMKRKVRKLMQIREDEKPVMPFDS